MRLSRAVDRYLTWLQVETDATERTVQSYAWVLGKLCDHLGPDAMLATLDGRAGTDTLRGFLAQWARLSASSRANRISVLRSFFEWAEREELVADSPARRIQRPPKRKATVYRPTAAELALVRAAASIRELPAIVLMEGAGLRNSEILSTRWRDLDLALGELTVTRKGGKRVRLPLAPDVADTLRDSYRHLEPHPDDHVFVAEVLRFHGRTALSRERKDPTKPASPQALQRMLARVCARAGVRPLTPHQLRHGFAVRFLRDTGDIRALQGLLSHSQITTTETYLDDIRFDELRDALDRAHTARHERRPARQPDSDRSRDRLQTGQRARRDSNPRSAPTETPSREDTNPSTADAGSDLTEGVSQSADE